MNQDLIPVVMAEAERREWNFLEVNLSATDQQEVFHFSTSWQQPNTIVFILNRSVRKIKPLSNYQDFLYSATDTLAKY